MPISKYIPRWGDIDCCQWNNEVQEKWPWLEHQPLGDVLWGCSGTGGSPGVVGDSWKGGDTLTHHGVDHEHLCGHEREWTWLCDLWYLGGYMLKEKVERETWSSCREGLASPRFPMQTCPLHLCWFNPTLFNGVLRKSKKTTLKYIKPHVRRPDAAGNYFSDIAFWRTGCIPDMGLVPQETSPTQRDARCRGEGWAGQWELPGVGRSWVFSCLLHICSIGARSLRWVAGGRATAAAKTSYSVSLSGYSPPWANPSLVQLFRFSAAAIWHPLSRTGWRGCFMRSFVWFSAGASSTSEAAHGLFQTLLKPLHLKAGLCCGDPYHKL